MTDSNEMTPVIERFVGLFGRVLPEHVVNDLAVSQEADRVLQTVGWGAVRAGVQKTVRAASPESWFGVDLNGVELELPRYTVLTMSHCAHGSFEDRIKLVVEYEHWRMMLDELRPGSVFIDVGAATGAMTVPFALSHPKVRFFAFEPYARVRGVLEQTLDRNGVAGRVTVMRQAVSETVGEMTFLEQPDDEQAEHNYLPETSSLALPGVEDVSYGRAHPVTVQVTTLDRFAEQVGLEANQPCLIKIDVEGFEAAVIKGARRMIEALRPTLYIDIHWEPGTTEYTDAKVMNELSTLGYRFGRLGHVLICRPG